MYKALIVGCGKIAGFGNPKDQINRESHGYAYLNNPEIDLVGCVDINNEAGNEFSKRFNCDYFSDLGVAIKTVNPDVFSVCTPDNTHFKITKYLIEKAKPLSIIFLEKPACSNENEMKELLKLSMGKKIIILVNHSRRFDNRYSKIKQNISSGEYGSFINGFATYYSGWQHNGIHVVDTLSFIFKEAVKLVSISQIIESPYPNDPTIEGKLVFEKSKKEIQLYFFEETYYQLFEFDLRFENSRLRIEDFGSRITLENKYINGNGENVLKMSKNSFGTTKNSSIQNAISKIINYLNEKNIDILKGHRLEDASLTMKSIWEGISLYEN